MKPIIRSVTVFMRKPVHEDYENYAEEYGKSSAELTRTVKILKNHGYRVFTERISFPKLPNTELIFRVIDKIDTRERLVSLGAIDIEHIDSEKALEITSRGYYFSMYGFSRDPLNNSRKASEIIENISSENPVYATRFSISFHEEPLETPYFPDSTSSGKKGIGIAFLYPDIIKDMYRRTGSLEEVAEKLNREIKEIISILRENLGENSRIVIDYSLSPWMENSVVSLLEELGYTLGSPGFNYGILLINEFIQKIANTSGYAGGFNEVMLPYAEDSKLIEAGSKGVLHARDFLLYSSTCVAGPDMLILPKNTDKLRAYLLDAYSIWRIKKKAMSTRIIIVDGKPCDKVSLGKFGEAYIIDY